jgi:2-dehydro-3-deoxygalactonokinase
MTNTGNVIAVDWGTSRFRAYLVDARGICERVASNDGISAAAGGDFARILRRNCGRWMDNAPNAPVIMAGMVGSRNGWREVPYAACPASLADIARGVETVEIAPGRTASIVPGVLFRSDGVADVMRGEEALAFGTRAENGIIVMPGTHSKWIRMENGRIAEFQSFLTGEVYGLLRHQSVLRLLAEEPEDEAGLERGFAAADRAGGPLHQAFEARTGVLDGTLPAAQVGPFLSGLLIATEIKDGQQMLDGATSLTLVADGALADNYRKAFERRSIKIAAAEPESCLAAGLKRIVEASASTR